LNSWGLPDCDKGLIASHRSGWVFHGVSTLEPILIALKAVFRHLNGKGGVSLPKLLVGFIGGIFAPRPPYREIL